MQRVASVGLRTSIEHARWRHLQSRGPLTEQRTYFFGQEISPKLSSAPGRFASLPRANNTKKQHLYIENNNSGLTTAIFVAFGGALAEELMCLCQHAKTELYNYINVCVYIFILQVGLEINYDFFYNIFFRIYLSTYIAYYVTYCYLTVYASVNGKKAH